MKRAWAFYRRSTEKQEVSVEDQRRVCRANAAQNGMEIVREFVPAKGYASGLTIDRDEAELRKAVKKTEEEMDNLLDAIKAGLKWGRAQDEIRRLEERKRSLQDELAQARRSRLAAEDLDEAVDQMLGYLDEFGQLIASGTVEQKKAVFKTFVHKIILDREQRKATAFFYTVPVMPQLRSIPYPKEVVASLAAGPRRAGVMIVRPPTPLQPKEIAGSLVEASGGSFSNIGCGGWI